MNFTFTNEDTLHLLKTENMCHVSGELEKYEWTFKRTRNAMGTPAERLVKISRAVGMRNAIPKNRAQ